MLKHTCKRLQNDQGHHQETSIAQSLQKETSTTQAQLQKTSNCSKTLSNALARRSETSNAQSQLKETFNFLFTKTNVFLHFIYNQRCKLNNAGHTLKALEFIRYKL